MKCNTANFIIGGGYLGRQLAQLLKDETVYISSRQESKRQQFRDNGFQAVYLDINECVNNDLIEAFDASQPLKVYCLIPPSQIDVARFPLFLQQLLTLNIERAVISSSTVVYGKPERTVDADSDVIIDSERAEKQIAIERHWQTTNDKFYVMRFAGLYGPDRIIGKRQLLNNASINSDPKAWLNLIHVEDAARLLVSTMDSTNVSKVELGCDNQPIKREDYYSWLAKRLNTNAPKFLAQSEIQRGANRKCSNVITQQRTGWSPEYENFQQGLSSLID